MNAGSFRIVVVFLIVALIAAGFLTVRFVQISSRTGEMEAELVLLQRDIDSLKTQVPGLGEYMTTNQLHMAKLWFAGKSSNWQLAGYELGEIQETMEAAEGLHAVKNGVDITPVLQSTRQTQLRGLEEAVKARNVKNLFSAYDQTLAACNSCHKAAGYGFIHITTPTHEPVANQQWKMSDQ